VRVREEGRIFQSLSKTFRLSYFRIFFDTPLHCESPTFMKTDFFYIWKNHKVPQQADNQNSVLVVLAISSHLQLSLLRPLSVAAFRYKAIVLRTSSSYHALSLSPLCTFLRWTGQLPYIPKWPMPLLAPPLPHRDHLPKFHLAPHLEQHQTPNITGTKTSLLLYH